MSNNQWLEITQIDTELHIAFMYIVYKSKKVVYIMTYKEGHVTVSKTKSKQEARKVVLHIASSIHMWPSRRMGKTLDALFEVLFSR